MMIQATFYATKKFFQKNLSNLKSFVLACSRIRVTNPIISDCKKDNSISKQRDSNETTKKDGDENYTKSSITDCSKVNDVKEAKSRTKYSRYKQEEKRAYLAADHLARKMKELEMMDMNDADHVVDIEEVLHYYSHLKSPAYLEIVDNFFMDMYLEFNLPMPSTRSFSTSMRKLGSTRSINSSTRRLGSRRSVNSSMRKVGGPSVHGSMRSLGPVKQ